jgi:uncharacterized protein
VGFKIIETMTGEEPSESSTEHMVPTRDGVELATDVFLPDNPTRHSAILSRTPYDKRSFYTALKFEGEYFRGRGFAFVAQDVRGKFRSTGQTVPYAFDIDDAYDTVEWIVRQPWSNGKVGVVGASYSGFLTWAAVASRHPAIKAAIPMVTGVDMADGHIGGRWRQRIQSFVALNDLLQIWSNNNGYLAEINWDDEPVEAILADARGQIGPCVGAEEKVARTRGEEWSNPYGDRHPYWTTQIPILHWVNWYDPGLAPDGMQDWRHFRSIAGWQGLHYLRADSADHGGYKLADVSRGDEANPYLNKEALDAQINEASAEQADFFDEHLNGVKPSTPRPRARWHVGHVGWQETEEYPPTGQRRVFTLGPSHEGVHALVAGESAGERDLTWVHDPADPVPSAVDMEALWYFCAAYPDERALAERKDVLTFRTEPLADDLDVAGQPMFTGDISFSGPSTHVHVKLQDIYPDGTTRRISQARASLTEKTGGRLQLALDDNAYRVRAGHCLQLQIMSSDCPHFVVHPGTDDNTYDIQHKVSTTQTLHLGGPDGARLELLTIDVAE